MRPKDTPRRPGRARAARAIYWSNRAVSDLEAIGDHIAADSPVAAHRWVLKLAGAAEDVGHAPLAGRRVPELGRDDVREVLVRTYRIVYKVAAERVDILAIFEGHRRFPDDVTGEPA